MFTEIVLQVGLLRSAWELEEGKKGNRIRYRGQEKS